MAATATASEAAEAAASGSLKCKTWVLKVSIHCEGCKREVKKALLKLEGVYKISVDSQQHKVTVTGNINSEELLNKLSRIGKHAEIFPENSPEKTKQEKGDKQKVQRAQTGELVNNQDNITPTQTPDTSRKTTNSAKNSNPGGKVASKNSNSGGKAVAKMSNSGGKAIAKSDKESNVVLSGGNKNKGKVQKGNSQMKGDAATQTSAGSTDHQHDKTQEVAEKDLSPQGNQNQITVPNPTVEESVLSQEIILSYNSAHHDSGRMHDLYHQYIPPQPYVYTDADQIKTAEGQLVQEQGQVERPNTLHSFDMFSEENANGCSIM